MTTPTPVLDDHGGQFSEATPVQVPSATFGKIETIGDRDYFYFSAQAGVAYTIETTLFGLDDSFIGLYGTTGDSYFGLAQNDDYSGKASRIEYTPSSFGKLIVLVASYKNMYTGAYAISIYTPQPTTRYTLKVSVSPFYSGGSVAQHPKPDAEGMYPSGTVVILMAGPSGRYQCFSSPYWSFGGWSGDVTGGTPTISVILDDDKDITAGFGEFFPPKCVTPTPAAGPVPWPTAGPTP